MSVKIKAIAIILLAFLIPVGLIGFGLACIDRAFAVLFLVLLVLTGLLAVLVQLGERWLERRLSWAVQQLFGRQQVPSEIGIEQADSGQTDDEQDQLERLPHPDIRKRRDDALRLWGDGLTTREIAERLFVSESTVKRDLEKLREGMTQS